MKGLLGGGSGGETSTQGAATPSARSKHTVSRRKYLGPSTSTAPPTAPHQRPSAAKTSSKAALPTTPGKGERHQQSVDSKEDAKEGKKEVSGRSGASGRPLASWTPALNRGSKKSLNTGAKGKLGDAIRQSPSCTPRANRNARRPGMGSSPSWSGPQKDKESNSRSRRHQQSDSRDAHGKLQRYVSLQEIKAAEASK